MADPRRLDPSAPTPAVRDSQIESLLVEGLEAYFNQRYEDAVHVWTRVLFLDRSHSRARAYIERAQAAIAERQRRGEAKIQEGQSLLDQGDAGAARDLLREAISEAGDDERASALRVRLERLERATAPVSRTAPVIDPASLPQDEPLSTRRTWIWGSAGVAAAAMMVTLLVSSSARAWLGLAPANEALTLPNLKVALPVLSTSDVQLVRARMLYGKGRLSEALQALDRVGVDSASRASADALRVEIQRLLLASAQLRPHGGNRP